MATVATELHGEIHLPDGINTLAAFCDWVDTADLPEKLSVHFLRGEPWVDLGMEEMFSHNQVKTALGETLAPLIRAGDLGRYVTDGMQLVNEEADIATDPDAMFVSHATREAGRVRFTAGKKRGAKATRMVGTPDLVVEIVSPITADKDTEWLMSAYHNAGIPEYWLIDARDDAAIRFDIYRRGPRGYTASRKSDGWVKSTVLGKSFRLTQTKDRYGDPLFTLDVR